jgi:hypothetical protein
MSGKTPFWIDRQSEVASNCNFKRPQNQKSFVEEHTSVCSLAQQLALYVEALDVVRHVIPACHAIQHVFTVLGGGLLLKIIRDTLSLLIWLPTLALRTRAHGSHL